jgi:hypothetical protein
MVKRAFVKRKGKPKLAASIKSKSQHFAAFEFCVHQNGFAQLCQAQIAAVKLAINKPKARKVFACKLAAIKNAVLVLAFYRRIFCKAAMEKGFTLYVCFLHFETLINFSVKITFFELVNIAQHYFLFSNLNWDAPKV